MGTASSGASPVSPQGPSEPDKDSEPDKLPHIKPSRVTRFLKREGKQNAFLDLDPEDRLAYMEKNQRINDEKKKIAEQQKWNRKEGGNWEEWNHKWYWREWKFHERWLGPY